MFDLPWELWRNWALVQGAILFVSWLVIKFGKIEEETEDKKENGEA
jgi:hypothetical protein